MEKEKEILRNLIAERVELKVTQQEMARRTGMSQQAISRLELLEHEPSLKRFLSYAEALGYDLQLVKKEKQPDQNTLSEKASDDNKTKKTEQSKLNKFESAESTSNECNQALLKKPLPVGVSSFKDVCDGYYYVDKTLLIKDFLDERPKVTLFTRPRRFGKSLTMDMLRTFFEHTKADTSAYFKDKKIWQQGQRYRDHQGKYPVIFISFKDAGKDSWEHTLDYIIQLIRTEYRRHSELAGSDRISDRDFYEAVIKDTLKSELYDYSLFMLSRMLHEHFGIAPVLIIDE